MEACRHVGREYVLDTRTELTSEHQMLKLVSLVFLTYILSANKTKLFIQTVISTETINGWTTFDPIPVFVVDLKVQ